MTKAITAFSKKCCNCCGQWTKPLYQYEWHGWYTLYAGTAKIKRPPLRTAFFSYKESRALVIASAVDADLHFDHVLDSDIRVLGFCLADEIGVYVKDTKLYDLFR